MLKKLAASFAIALTTVTAYANAPVMHPVTHTELNQPFTITQTVWGYQFNNQTGKNFSFTTTVPAATDPSKVVSVSMQCWHWLAPVEEYTVSSGQSVSCTTNDTIRLVTPNDQQSTVSGTFSITVSSK